MVDQQNAANEFVATIDKQGNITVPPDLAKSLAGAEIHVRIQSNEIAGALREKMVTEEEIALIRSNQLESRDQVVRFLLSEGALKTDRAFSRRTMGRRS